MKAIYGVILFACITSLPILGGCHPKTTASSSTLRSKEPWATITRTGGIAGVNDRVLLTVNGWFSLHQRYGALRSTTGDGQLPADVLRDLSAALDATAGVNKDYPAAHGSADGLEYTLTYRDRTIRWSETATDLPPALLRIAELFSQFAGSEK